MPQARREGHAPWRDGFKSREALLEFAGDEARLQGQARQGAIFDDANLLHTSAEGEVLEDPSGEVPDYVYSRTNDPAIHQTGGYIEVEFSTAMPVTIDDKKLSPRRNATALDALGGRWRRPLDLVENRLVGVKPRGMYRHRAAPSYFRASRHRNRSRSTAARRISKTS